MIQGFSDYYTFHIGIKRNEDTVLDVTLGANGNQEEIDKAKKTMQRLLNSYTPSFKEPELKAETIPAAPKFVLEDQVPVEPTAPPEPEPPSASSQEPKPEGVRGLVRLHCSACGSTFGTFLREHQSDIACKCGHRIDLTVPLAGYRFTCPYCEKETWGRTNLEDPTISIKCKCGGQVDLQWVPKAKEYQN